jgi:DNA-binding NarL/FixJ family response regulator
MKACVVDGQEVVRAGLGGFLSASVEPPIDLVADVATGMEALRVQRLRGPGLVLTEHRLRDTSADRLCRALHQIDPTVRVVVLTTDADHEVERRCRAAGAAGFVTKEAGLAALARVLDTVVGGRPPHARPGRPSLPREPDPVLTQQQERVVELMVDGLTYGQIGRRLHLSESTVRFHVRGIKDRLGVGTRAELIVTAVRDSLVPAGSLALAGTGRRAS